MSMAKTIKDFLHSDIIDIEKLLLLALGVSKSSLYINPNYKINATELAALNMLIQKRQNGEPLAYLSRSKGFYHLDFKVTKNTLIPRPETELLIDISLTLFGANKAVKVLDLGTGSGAIAITLADKCNGWQVSASDKSLSALEVAKYNAKNTHNSVNFSHGSWFDAVPNQSFDLIVSNPPYVECGDSHLADLKFEPIEALSAGVDGLNDIHNIIENSPKHLNANGYLLIEHGYNQQSVIMHLMQQSFVEVVGFKDSNGIDRATLGKIK